MTTPALRLLAARGAPGEEVSEPAWLEWLVANVDPAWRPGEWDHEHFLFSGDLDSDRTVAWRCRTPSCPAVTRRHHGRCDTCRRAQSESGIPDEEFDREARRVPFFPLVLATCSVLKCAREVASRGLCVSHYRTFHTKSAAEQTLEEFTAAAKPLGFSRRLSHRGLPETAMQRARPVQVP